MVATKICKRLILNMPTVYYTHTLYAAGTWAQVLYRYYDDVCSDGWLYSDHPNATIHNKFTIYKVVYCFLIGLFKSGCSYCIWICGDAYAHICIWWVLWAGRFFLNNSFERIMPLLFAQLYHTGQPKRVNLSLIRATGEKPKKSCERHVVWLVNKINNEGVYGNWFWGNKFPISTGNCN